MNAQQIARTKKRTASPSGPMTSTIGNRILFLGAHCDDTEIGCGGTAAKYAAAGCAVAFAIAANCGPERRNEAQAAAGRLGLKIADNSLFFGFIPDGRLAEAQDVLQNWLKDVVERFSPDTVFVHHGADTHPDHEALYRVSIRVFNRQNLLLYSIPKLAAQATPFQANYYEDISEFLQTKLELCACHVSQAAKSIYLNPSQIKAVAQVAYLSGFGQSGGYAEAFKIHVTRSSPAKPKVPSAPFKKARRRRRPARSSPAITPAPSVTSINVSLRAWAGGGSVNLVIVTTDIVSHSKLVNDIGEVAWGPILIRHFNHSEHLVKKHHGFFVKSIGDAVLAVFRNSVEALNFALAFEAGTGDPRVRIRVGINSGQIEVTEDDLYGLNVNLAFRIAKKATQGGIWVSDPVKRDADAYDRKFLSPWGKQWRRHSQQKLGGFRESSTLWSVEPSSCPPPTSVLRSIAPSRLPHSAEHLFGREQELEVLDRAWNDPSIRILTIYALGGAGKTSLVVEWMARKAMANWPGFERVFDWSFSIQGTREQGAMSADAFIAAALEFFGDPAMAHSAAFPQDKGARLAQLVAEHRTLLVLDGLEPLQHPPGPLSGHLKDPALEALLRGMALHNPGLCLLTTREPVADLTPYRHTTVSELELRGLSTLAGVELLTRLGVHGLPTAFAQLVQDVQGHALTLNLLGRFLVEAHGGDIHKRNQVRLEQAGAAEQGGHAFRVMESYEKWFATEGDNGRRLLAILRVLGLFDHPAEPACLAELRKQPPIPDLTEPLVDLTQAQWDLSLDHLAFCGLVSRPSEPSALGHLPFPIDTHPLVREHFRQQVRTRFPAAWEAGNKRLYEHLTQASPRRPDTLEEMMPLLAAVVHGCAAGLHGAAFYDVYWRRIARGHRHFLRDTLGAVGLDFNVLCQFFVKPWKQVSEHLQKKDQGFIFVYSGLVLRSQGLLAEAEEALLSGKTQYRAIGHKVGEANASRHLSQLYLLQGDSPRALCYAQEAVELAAKTDSIHERINSPSTLGDVYHQLGNFSKALRCFQLAEMEQRKKGPMLLDRLAGYRFGDLLLTLGDYDEVIRRAEKTLRSKRQRRFRLGYALNLLILATAQLHNALSTVLKQRPELGLFVDVRLSAPLVQVNNLTEINRLLNEAVEELRKAGQEQELPRGLLIRAALRRISGDLAGAASDLSEANEFAERTGMKLFQAGALLESACQALARRNVESGAENARLLAQARECLARAKKIITETGYHRRDPEVRCLEQHLEKLATQDRLVDAPILTRFPGKP
jgi:LmbE family N-acetylglucosaminyl deacetylase/class 3 adenylate cyclase/tetratricopeptide (TPR) repeat protein